jgi:SAM-dependent methyltransferase
VDWRAWHDGYDQPDSVLGRRLLVVQERIRLALDDCPPGRLRVVSLCAGQGHDLLGALERHPRREDVTARLVELDPRNAALAKRAAEAAGLRRIEVVVGDAALTRHYSGMVPADIVLACGVFGNITDQDIKHTVARCSQLCTNGGTLVWTRNRKPPDLVPWICRLLEEAGFERQWLSGPDEGFGVGVHRFTGEPQLLDSSARLFAFIGYDVLAQTTKPG